ncbi:MAG TPA: TldD/PmbA family protein, partial [Gemmatimonadales bacterium]|nr:TldD/PmbA family protein [Gemmatimonadales bacterium]
TRFAGNQISTSGDNTNTSVTVRSVVGSKVGQAGTNRLDEAGLKAVVDMSERLARLSPDDPELMPELDPQQYQPGLGWSESTARLDPAGRAAAAGSITEQARSAGLVSTGYLETRATAQAIANSKGLFAYDRDTDAVLTTTVRTADGQGSGWAGGASNAWSALDPAALGARAVDKAKRSVGAVAIEPGRYTVVLEPTAVGNLLQLLTGAMNARGADEGRSFFSRQGGGNKIGEKVMDERVTLASDPFDPDSYGAPFTGEGLPTRRVVWIENGVVKNLNYDRFWARKQGKEPTGAGGGFGGGGGGVKMLGGDETVDSLVAGCERGLLVTRFWYIRGVDPRSVLFTGLTRDGTFLIENGTITKAVKNFRFNESPVIMLNNILAMGKPVRVSASESGNAGAAVVVPPLRIRDFNFTSLSDAI